MPLKFSREEYSSRLEKLRGLMDRNGLDAVVVTNHQNVNYFAGITSILAGIPGGYGTVRPLIVVLPKNLEPTVIVQFTDEGNARANSWISDVRSWVNLPFHHRPLESVLRDKGLDSRKIGMELSREFHLAIPYSSFQGLKEALPNAQFLDAADLIWELRMIKSAAEVELIRSAARITAQALQENLPRVEVGMSERQIANEVGRSLLQHGADKFNYVSAIAGEGTYEQFCRLPTDRQVSEGELVWCDLSAIYRDYCSDMSSFVVVGGATEAHRKFIDIARDVHLGMVDFIRPGLRACDVMHHVKESYRKAGLDWNFDIGRCGHGIGLELAEQPSLDDNSTVVLEPGMTLALEPAVLTHNGVYDMEEDVLVTEDGCEVLAPVWPR
jgi:Xaa-Pro aminopeptidase